MEVYLVGGAVRDGLLAREVKERDWVVVGGSAEAMLRQGYRQVGRNFPVFLHPETQEEYALARTERKTAAGHAGFATDAGPQVTLRQDLARRDLTINAMAQDRAGRLIDPFGGCRDIKQRLLRHVTQAFAEDPLRVFRVARFAASLEGFSVHPDTCAFMAGMVEALAELPGERVWTEFRKALAAVAPQRFLEVLKDCHCLGPWFPELEDSRIAPTLDDALACYGGLGWSLSTAAADALGKRLKAPKVFIQLARDIARHGRSLGAWRQVDAAELDAILVAVNAYRDQNRRRRIFAVVAVKANMDELEAALGRIGREMAAKQADWSGLSGVEIGRRFRQRRLNLLAQFLGAG